MNTILIKTDLVKDKDIIVKEGVTVAHRIQAEIELLVAIKKSLDYITADIRMDFADSPIPVVVIPLNN